MKRTLLTWQLHLHCSRDENLKSVCKSQKDEGEKARLVERALKLHEGRKKRREIYMVPAT